MSTKTSEGRGILHVGYGRRTHHAVVLNEMVEHNGICLRHAIPRYNSRCLRPKPARSRSWPWAAGGAGDGGGQEGATLAAPSREGRRLATRILALLAVAVCLGGAAPAARADVKVAVLRGWGSVSAFSDLNSNWSAYGTTPLAIDSSLVRSSSFTYEDLVRINANVLWLSNPSGGTMNYTPAEIQAVQRYASEGHSLLGTYVVFQYGGCDNRGLAPLFGLGNTTSYNSTEIAANQSFTLLAPSNPLFARLSNPYVSSGFPLRRFRPRPTPGRPATLAPCNSSRPLPTIAASSPGTTPGRTMPST